MGSPAPRQGRPACGTRHPDVHLRGSAGCCARRGGSPLGLPAGCWLGGRELARAQFAGACFKSSPRSFGPHAVLPHGRPNVRAAPSAGQAPAAVQGCAMETVRSSQGEAGELERTAPTLAGGGGGERHGGATGSACVGFGLQGYVLPTRALCSAARCPHCSPLPWPPGPSPAFPAGVTTVCRESGGKRAQTTHLCTKV